MDKKGFTLVELLVVIAIIAILSLLVVPNVISINRNINERLLGEKQDEVVNAAQLYGTDYEEIFNGKNEVHVYVSALIEQGLLTVDAQQGESNCNDATALNGTNKGCMIDPVSKNSMNGDYVILRKESIGVVGVYICTEGRTCPSTDPSNPSNPSGPQGGTKTLVKAVCDGLRDGNLKGKAYGGGDCSCTYTGDEPTGINPPSAQACIITGTDPNNYLQYSTMWRVLGVYMIDKESGGGKELSAKIITNQTVN